MTYQSLSPADAGWPAAKARRGNMSFATCDREAMQAAVNHVISVTGMEGNPQPDTWRILLENPGARGVREVEVTNGQISEGGGGRHIVGSAEGATINTRRLNLDSSGAYSVASYTAD